MVGVMVGACGWRRCLRMLLVRESTDRWTDDERPRERVMYLTKLSFDSFLTICF